MVKALEWLFLWSFKEKASAVSRDTAFSLGSVRGCFISTVRWKYSLFSSFLFGGLHGWGVLLVIPSERHRKRHQQFPVTQPFFMDFSLLRIRSIRNKKTPVMWGGIICGTVIERELCYTVQWIESFLWVLSVALWWGILLIFLGCVIGNGWCLISWRSTGMVNKMPQSWRPSAEKLGRALYL